MKPVTLNMTWRGERPKVGCFLRTARGRTAYEITAIRAAKSTMKTLGSRRLVLTCARWEPKEVPAEATVLGFTWNRRTRSRA